VQVSRDLCIAPILRGMVVEGVDGLLRGRCYSGQKPEHNRVATDAQPHRLSLAGL
jgi:hypothetical protein